MTTPIEARLNSIEARLTRIESYLHLSIQPASTSSQAATSTEKISATARKAPWQMKLISKPGGWLGIVAVICFILAAAFILKLSIESGWLTPARQIALAYLLGMALIVAGFMLLHKDKEYASLLPAAGVIILDLTTFAAHQLYPLISFATAIAITSVISILCVWLYLRIKHDVYAITAAAGAYLSPVILGFNETAVFSLYYFIVCSLAFSVISIWVQSRTLTVLAAYLAILVTAHVGFDLNQAGLIAILLPVHFVIFAIGSFLFTRETHHPLTEREAWSFFPVLVIFYATEYYFLDQYIPGLAPWISLTFAALVIVLYISAKKLFSHQTLASRPMILAFATLVAFHSIYMELLPETWRPWLFVIIVFAGAWLPSQYYSRKNFRTFSVPALALLGIAAIEYIEILFNLFSEWELSWFVVALAAFISIWFLLLHKEEDVSKEDEYGYALLGAAHLLAITGLYQLTTDHGSLAVSTSWLLYAVAVMAFAFVRKDKVMARSALIILSFAAAKALLYDAASAPTVVRILCLLITGVVLYGSGFLMRKITNWKSRV